MASFVDVAVTVGYSSRQSSFSNLTALFEGLKNQYSAPSNLHLNGTISVILGTASPGVFDTSSDDDEEVKEEKEYAKKKNFKSEPALKDAKFVRLDYPNAIYFDKRKDELWVASQNTSKLYKILFRNSSVEEIKGLPKLSYPRGMTHDCYGNWYLAEFGLANVWQLNANETNFSKASVACTGISASMFCYDANKNIYCCDNIRKRVCKLTPKQVIGQDNKVETYMNVETIAEKVQPKPTEREAKRQRTGKIDIPTEWMQYPWAVALDPKRPEELFVSDYSRHVILKIDTHAGTCELFAGSTTKFGHRDGTCQEALFHEPAGMCFHNNVLYICDRSNGCIRMIDTKTRMVSSLTAQNKLPPIFGIAIDLHRKCLYVSGCHAVFKIT